MRRSQPNLSARRESLANVTAAAPFAEPTASGPTNIEAADPTLADDLLWGAAAIAKFIGVKVRRAFYLLEKGLIPARKLGKSEEKKGSTWVTTKTRLRRHFNGNAS